MRLASLVAEHLQLCPSRSARAHGSDGGDCPAAPAYGRKGEEAELRFEKGGAAARGGAGHGRAVKRLVVGECSSAFIIIEEPISYYSTYHTVL